MCSMPMHTHRERHMCTHNQKAIVQRLWLETWLSIISLQSRGLQPGVENGEGSALVMAEAFIPQAVGESSIAL